MKYHQPTCPEGAARLLNILRLRTITSAVCFIASVSLGNAAAVISKLDWFNFNPGADQTHFSLVDDNGAPVAQAHIQLASGLLVPLSPSAGMLLSDFWVTAPNFEDSLSGNTSLATTKIQVAPQSDLVQYRLVLTGTDLTGMTFAVGQLFGTGGSGRSEISARTAAASEVSVNFFDTHGWDDGLRAYVEPVSWDNSLQVLTTGASANGESAVSFFKVTDVGSPVTQLSFYFPSGHNGKTGDAVEFAFGMTVIPEPSAAALVVIAFGFMLGGFRSRN